MEDIVIVGRHAVKEAIISGHAINKILIQDGIKKQQINDILKNAKSQKLIVQTVPKSKLDFLANAPHQGVAALVAPYEYANFDEFLQKQKKKDRYSTVIILDGLEDPHNLGSILRTADASGVDAVIIPKRRSVAIKIPMVGHVNSLNASVAASLMMYEVYRKRHQLEEKS
ncbi:MAG: RNA methyltransferase [Staphylococcus epidermidis]|nr:RNA methyltransferase [Staphylococcus epidermidis]